MRIGFVLLSNPLRPIPSTRVAVLNMLPLLRTAGCSVSILHEPGAPSETPALPAELFDRAIAAGCDVVVFQKVHGAEVLRLVDRLAAAGVATAYLVCDLVDAEMCARTDATLVVTEFLRSLYPAALAHKVHVVHDGIERAEIVKPAAAPPRRGPLRAVLVTSAPLDALPVLGFPPRWLDVTIVGAYPPRSEWLARLRGARWAWAAQPAGAARGAYLRFLAHPRIHRERWSPDGVYRALLRADVGILPIDTSPAVDDGGAVPAWKLKSENRLTLKMAVGLSVVATPIPSYEPVVEQGRNGFLARSREQWLDALDALREPALRARIGAEARRTALAGFTQQAQAERLQRALRAAVDARAAAESVRSEHSGAPR